MNTYVHTIYTYNNGKKTNTYGGSIDRAISDAKKSMILHYIDSVRVINMITKKTCFYEKKQYLDR